MRYSQTVIHFLVGESWDAPCGLRSLWHRGLAYTRTPARTTCRRCRHWLAASPWAPVIVSPPHLRVNGKENQW
jgi:hypothetical protein